MFSKDFFERGCVLVPKHPRTTFEKGKTDFKDGTAILTPKLKRWTQFVFENCFVWAQGDKRYKETHKKESGGTLFIERCIPSVAVALCFPSKYKIKTLFGNSSFFQRWDLKTRCRTFLWFCKPAPSFRKLCLFISIKWIAHDCVETHNTQSYRFFGSRKNNLHSSVKSHQKA